MYQVGDKLRLKLNRIELPKEHRLQFADVSIIRVTEVDARGIKYNLKCRVIDCENAKIVFNLDKDWLSYDNMASLQIKGDEDTEFVGLVSIEKLS